MKTNMMNTTSRFTGLAVALALVAGLTGAASAVDVMKGGERQLDLLGGKTRAVPTASTYAAMACSKCKDEYLTRVDWNARGAYKPAAPVVKHLCDACDTTKTTVGRGKLAKDVVAHKCTSCGMENLACCNMTRGSGVATKGMEKKTFEVAPVK